MSADVELVNVTKYFGDFKAVDDITFSVDSGSFFSLLGPSGCGKSTTLRMASGFEHPDQGELRIAGLDMRNVSPYRRPTNMVFQRWALFPHMSVFENVAFGLKVERLAGQEIRRRVGELLELVGLQEFAQRKPGQLSGGQMQRVALARALVKRPKVLLLDEPLGALDLKLRLQMQLELKRIQQDVGTTFIYVTHDQGEAMTMSDRIAIMNEGRIEQMGTPQEIYDRPGSRFVAAFIGNTNLFDVEVEEVADGRAVVRAGEIRFAGNTTPGVALAPAQASIRYELIRIGAASEGLPNRFEARVRDVIFSGSSVQYVLQLGNPPLEVLAEVHYDGSQPLLSAGQVVTAGWSDQAARLFPTASVPA
ncbi:MAG: ABC transporter ATP-binding protein [Trueperaceae bacterium]